MRSLGIPYRGRATMRRHPRPLAGLLGSALLGALVLGLLPGGATAAVLYPPLAGPAVKTAEGFELKGTVYPYGNDTTYHFEYGTTIAYGQSAPMPDADAGTAISVAVSQPITGLQANTTYHYRLVSTNTAEGPGFSADRTFSTAEGTSTPPAGAPGGSAPTGGGAMEPPSGGKEPGTIAGGGPKTVAKEVKSKGQLLLASKAGRTLYSLSVERHGHFVCTMSSGCLSVWHPLTVAAGVTPKGPVKLGTVRRPEGDLQVTYRGRPLYSFGGDTKPGQRNGEGIKDVGVWHAALVPNGAQR
jgi:predicted lipoprotein with Yx(FWY)xxD motif